MRFGNPWTRVVAVAALGLVSGAEATARVELPIAGTIFMHGGGPLGNDHLDEFVKLCGEHGKLVVIPSAIEKADDPEYAEKIRRNWERRELPDAVMLHTNDRAEANSVDFVEPLTRADCVWFGGGSQGRIVDRYVGTRVEDELHALVLRGGVIAGYSAGMAVMTRVMIRQGNPDPEEAVGFGVLPGAIVDQHFVRNEREPRMLAMLARHPELVGFGVDERTTLIITGKRWRVFGHSVVRRCTVRRGCRDLLPGTSGPLRP
jgi:cyanophycinase